MEEKPKKDWKVLERHYKNLSEIWQFEYIKSNEVAEALMVLQGCIVEMHSDLIQFEIKNGPEKAEKSKERLTVITDKLQLISSIQTENYSLKYHNKLLNKQIERLTNIILDKEQAKVRQNQDLPDIIKL